MAWQAGGPRLAERVVASRSGSGLDPRPAQAFLAAGEKAFADLDQPSVWEVALATEPGEQPTVPEGKLDDCLSAVADFADLKSTWTVGHSRGVAGIAALAASAAGIPAQEALQLYHAALVHDIGRVTVPVRIWTKAAPLTRDEREQVRLHAYHSERVLDAAAALRPLARLAGSHGERCDGSGYHRGSRAGELPPAAWLLAAADSYHAMREPRPYRPALSPSAAADALAGEVRDGRLPAAAVNAVLAAAGEDRIPPVRPAGLSDRECEVLALLARGLATKQIARQLGISAKTCDHHIQSVYGKAGVSSRAAATMFALENGLTGTEAPVVTEPA
jgi:DNA-binding CsgD family transcriptional regulator